MRAPLIIEVPEAEAIVAGYQELFDANALLGIPAGVPVLAPFMRPQGIDAPVLTGCSGRSRQAGVNPFRSRLDHTDWFNDPRSMSFPPATAGLFRDLTPGACLPGVPRIPRPLRASTMSSFRT